MSVMITKIILVIVMLFSAASALAQTLPAPTTQPLPWGKEEAELRVRISAAAPVVMGGKSVLRLEIQNHSERPVPLSDAFVWIFVKLSREKAVYSAKILLADLSKEAAKELPAEQIWDQTVELSERPALAYQPNLTLIEGYPRLPEDLPAPALFKNILPQGKIWARGMVYLPVKKLLLISNTFELPIGEPDAQAMSPEVRKRIAAELLAQFTKDAVAGSNAHDRALRLGKPIVSDLLSGDADKLPNHGQMWYTATLLDLADPQALERVLHLLHKGTAGSQCVIAYRGPSWKNAALDEAIMKLAEKRPDIASWAARGYAQAKRQHKADFLTIALTAKEPALRADLAEMLVQNPTDKAIAALAQLVQDDEPLVRAQTAQAIAKANLRSAPLISGMIKGLSKPDAQARFVLCNALGKITGQNIPFDPKADKVAQQKTIAQWQSWWSQAKTNWKP